MNETVFSSVSYTVLILHNPNGVEVAKNFTFTLINIDFLSYGG